MVDWFRTLGDGRLSELEFICLFILLRFFTEFVSVTWSRPPRRRPGRPRKEVT